MVIMDEDIVYSMAERHSGKASQPTTTRSSSTSSLMIALGEPLVLLESLFFCRLPINPKYSFVYTDKVSIVFKN
jgi:hypothetical protein